MIKHFNVYPIGFNKNDLFEEQKKFLVYLMGFIPSLDDWSVQMDYKLKKEEIEKIKSVEISKSDLDLAKMQGKNIVELKKDRLIQEKERKLKELKDKFGIEEEMEDIKIEGIPDIQDEDNPMSEKEKLWDMLQGRNLIKKDG
jgi:hypothetical protein